MGEGKSEHDIRLYLELGRAYLKAQRYQDALDQLQAALSLAPTFADVNYQVGVVHGHLGNLDMAIEHYERALEANPTYLEARTSLADALFAQNRVEEAAHHQRLLQYVQEHKGLMYGLYGPKLANAHANAGDLYEEMGMHREAAQEYTKAVRIAPTFFDIVFKLARTYFELNELVAAREILEPMVPKGSPFRLDALRLLGSVLLKLGQKEDALAVWRELLEEAPEDTETLALLTRTK